MAEPYVELCARCPVCRHWKPVAEMSPYGAFDALCAACAVELRAEDAYEAHVPCEVHWFDGEGS